jgi:hypothetical protein
MNPRRQAKSDDEDDEEGLTEEERLLSERLLEKRERESYKYSFLTKLLEKEGAEEELQAAASQTPKGRKLPLTKALNDSKTIDMLT